MQTRLEEVLSNFPSRWLGRLLRVVVFPLGAVTVTVTLAPTSGNVP